MANKLKQKRACTLFEIINVGILSTFEFFCSISNIDFLKVQSTREVKK